MFGICWVFVELRFGICWALMGLRSIPWVGQGLGSMVGCLSISGAWVVIVYVGVW